MLNQTTEPSMFRGHPHYCRYSAPLHVFSCCFLTVPQYTLNMIMMMMTLTMTVMIMTMMKTEVLSMWHHLSVTNFLKWEKKRMLFIFIHLFFSIFWGGGVIQRRPLTSNGAFEANAPFAPFHFLIDLFYSIIYLLYISLAVCLSLSVTLPLGWTWVCLAREEIANMYLQLSEVCWRSHFLQHRKKEGHWRL